MSYSLHVFLFTLKQALCSMLMTVPIGVLMARALVWNQGWKPTQFCMKLLGLPLVTPGLVGILGLISLLGSLFNVYSFEGILAAHLIFYAPFVALFMLNSWRFIPEEHYRLASQLNFSSWQYFTHMELPQLKKPLLEVSWICFCLFLNSFTTVMILGGGPQKTTLSVALYQSFFFFYDPEQAWHFASLQLLLSLGLVVGTLFFKFPPQGTSSKIPSLPQLSSLLQRPLVVLALVLILSPLLAVLGPALVMLPQSLCYPPLWRAVLRSLSLSLTIGPASVALSILLIRYETFFSKPLASLYLLLPPALIGALLFMLSLELFFLPSDGFLLLIQFFIILPFTFRILRGPYKTIRENFHPMAHSLGLSSFHRLRIIEAPLLKKPLATALGMACALSLGDFQSLAFFPSPETPGLSTLLHMQMGKYNFEESMGTAFVLLLLCYGLYQLPHWILRLGEGRT